VFLFVALPVLGSVLTAVFGRKLDPRSVFSVYKLIFQCELVGGEARVSHETSEVAFFAKDALPELSQHRTHPRHLDAIFARLDDLARPRLTVVHSLGEAPSAPDAMDVASTPRTERGQA
jgi:hypothetical protein